MEHIRFALNQIKPGKATVGINETDIVIMTTHRGLGRPHISEDTISRGPHDSMKQKEADDSSPVDKHHKLLNFYY
jgi:hypothetical protein